LFGTKKFIQSLNFFFAGFYVFSQSFQLLFGLQFFNFAFQTFQKAFSVSPFCYYAVSFAIIIRASQSETLATIGSSAKAFFVVEAYHIC